MAVAQRQRTVVNPARRKLSAKQIKAGFGGKRRQAAIKKIRHKPAAKRPKSRSNAPKHRTRTVYKTKTVYQKKKTASRPNLGKIISYTLPKESQTVAKTKTNRVYSGTGKSPRRRPKAKPNRSPHRRRTHGNPSMGDITALIETAVFTVAGAVGSQQLTQVVLGTSNTGVMGYFGNLVAAFILSWGVKAFMKNDKAAGAVLAGGFVEIVLRLIADYTPFGQYTSNLGMGDYLAQWYNTPQQLKANVANWTHSAALATSPTFNLQAAGMGACGNGGSLYGGSLY